MNAQFYFAPDFSAILAFYVSERFSFFFFYAILYFFVFCRFCLFYFLFFPFSIVHISAPHDVLPIFIQWTPLNMNHLRHLFILFFSIFSFQQLKSSFVPTYLFIYLLTPIIGSTSSLTIYLLRALSRFPLSATYIGHFYLFFFPPLSFFYFYFLLPLTFYYLLLFFLLPSLLFYYPRAGNLIFYHIFFSSF